MNIKEMKLVIKAIMSSVIEIGLKQDERELALKNKDWRRAEEIKIELANYKKPSLSTIGEAGIGKTEAVEQVASEIGIPCLTFRVGEFVDNGDIQGMPRIVEHNGELKTVTMLPEFYPRPKLDADGNYMLRHDGGIMYDYEAVSEYIENYDEVYEFHKGDINQAPGLIAFYDEVNRVSAQDVKNALFKIFEKYGIGRYKYPNGTFIITATNPNTDDYGVEGILEEKAFKTRFVHIDVEKDNELLLDYMREKKYDKNIMKFVRQKSDEINPVGENYDLDIVPNSRTITFANTFIQSVKLHEKLPPYLFQEVMTGIVGMNAITLMEIMNSDFIEKINPEEIIFNYDKVEVEFLGLMEGDVDTSRLTKLKDEMLDYLFDIEETEKRIDLFVQNEENFEKFVKNFEDEYCYAFFDEMARKDTNITTEGKISVKPWNQIMARNNDISERIIELNERVTEGSIKKYKNDESKLEKVEEALPF